MRTRLVVAEHIDRHAAVPGQLLERQPGLLASDAEVARQDVRANGAAGPTAWLSCIRHESIPVSGDEQLDMHERHAGDLIIGYQIHAVLDEQTRPEHRERDGTVYYRDPGPGQKGMDEMPRPPREADGNMAWNCRCMLTPVLRD